MQHATFRRLQAEFGERVCPDCDNGTLSVCNVTQHGTLEAWCRCGYHTEVDPQNLDEI
jgi:hypothetical protein